MFKKVPQRRRKCGWNPIVVLVDMPVLCIARRQPMFLPVPLSMQSFTVGGSS